MTQQAKATAGSGSPVRTERTFHRFTLPQRWEHAVLMLSFAVLLLTGLPQKYRNTTWSQHLISTPERLETLQTIHRIAAVILLLLVVYHLGRGLQLLIQRRLPDDIFPSWKDILDAFGMIKYLLFLAEEKPKFGKYSVEQKFTYWFLFVAIGIMVVTGLVLWFPVAFTRVFPGGMIPAAKFAHSTEAIAAAVFVGIWHVYHVHIERLNLSMFTGWLNEEDMRRHHELEYQRLIGEELTPEEEGEEG